MVTTAYMCVCVCVRLRVRRMATSAKPIVIIDNIKDPFATVVSIQFGDYLEGLIDTVRWICHAASGIVASRQSDSLFYESETLLPLS